LKAIVKRVVAEKQPLTLSVRNRTMAEDRPMEEGRKLPMSASALNLNHVQSKIDDFFGRLLKYIMAIVFAALCR